MGNKMEKNKKNKKKFSYKTIVARKLTISMVLIFVLFLCLVVRIGWLQFVEGSTLKEMASRQQTLNKIITPTRGTIFDSNGKALAISAKVDTITINPSKFIINKKSAETLALQEKVAKGLSEIFELDYETVLAQVKSENTVETIIKKVEQELVDKLKTWMEENKITSGINIDEDNKRYYPYSNLAAHVIGFTGTDSQGLYGIEHYWDTVLQGTSGKIVTTKDVKGQEISGDRQQYVEVENGSNLYLTIDVEIQRIVEKYLGKGVSENNAVAGSSIVMNPKTGDIMAMATYPSYNPNSPNTMNLEQEVLDTLSKEEQNKKLFEIWSDRNFMRAYEPGSTFKLIVAATALEEDITEANIANDFSCTGSIQVANRVIRCAQSKVHGNQTLKQAVGNSCNSAFIQLGQRIGTATLYKYFRAFGLFEKTGVAITGESGSAFHALENVKQVELATTSFGQRFEITPLQLIAAVSSIANGGTLMQPRIVRKVVNADTGAVTEVEANAIRKVISEETAKSVREMMEYVVTNSGGKYGAVQGYSIGGKTGTSEPSPSSPEDGYTVSFISIAPVADPEVVILVVIYNPQGKNPYGSTIAAPIVSNILSEILPYLGIASEDSDRTGATTSSAKKATVPDVTNKTLTEAKKTLENLGFKVISEDTEKSNSVLVTEQVPPKNSSIIEGGIVVLYTEENTIRTSITVPNLIGMTLSEAKSALSSKNLNIFYSGSGKVVSQNIAERNDC